MLKGLNGRAEAFEFFTDILSLLMSQSLMVSKSGDTTFSCCHMDKVICGLSCLSWHC